MNRFSNGSPEQKMNLFWELMSEHVIAPLVKNGKEGHSELLIFLQRVYADVNAAAETLSEDDNATRYEDVLESVMTRLKGVAAFVNREHGYLKSAKKHAFFIKEEANTAQSSLYNTLTSSEFYRPMAAEYWQTIDAAITFVPMMRKLQGKISKVTADNKFDLKCIEWLEKCAAEITST